MRRPSPFARVRSRPCESGLGVPSVRPVAARRSRKHYDARPKPSTKSPKQVEPFVILAL